jgi:hypothetical protein
MLRLWQKHRYALLQTAVDVEPKRASRLKTALAVLGLLIWTWLVGFASFSAGLSGTTEPGVLQQALERELHQSNPIESHHCHRECLTLEALLQ